MRRVDMNGAVRAWRLPLAALALAAVTAAAEPSPDPFAGLESAATAQQVTDLVRKGDTFELIAKRWYTGYVEDAADGIRILRKANAVDPTKLRVGQRVVIPFPFEGKGRTWVAHANTQLESVAAAHYGYADYPATWWPLVYRANREKLVPGGRMVRKGTSLEIPALPSDKAGRQTLARQLLTDTMADLRRHLEAGELTNAGVDRFLLLQGVLPLLKKEVAGTDKTSLAEATREIERLWQVHGAAVAVDVCEKKLSEDPKKDPEELVTQVTAVSKQLEQAVPAAASNPSLSARLEAARQKLNRIVRGRMTEMVRELPHLLSLPATAVQTAARARQARYHAFQTRYHLSRLAGVPVVHQTAHDLTGALAVEMISVPEPEPALPAHPARVQRKDPHMKRSVAIGHKKYVDVWFPLAVAYARGLWKGFPECRDQWGKAIEPQDILRAIVMHESRGVHTENGSITKNANSETSVDYGFGQINNLAHTGTAVKLSEMEQVIGDPKWTVATIGSALDVPPKLRGQKVVLDFQKPAHNLVAMTLVLSYSINNKYPATSSPDEQLVKSLSGYNHGAFHPDYSRPWLDFVATVSPKDGEQGKVSAVAYGIGMKLYLGMPLEAAEIDWWKKFRKLSLSNLFYLFADPYHAYAHWK
ncbi:MAG: LysM peptidoglycan-binding domain-containing protein [Candidatus Wallbacteria bacterium]|nr:LysM peptidoglycan-binding domain-containing protein [Candidatus Wallbacteria bacterium]